mmetsp:Transcript_9435/g.19549  ORF Transcript_9435/g.19549 Transcript_9435/m.19549 type:complete len:350 (-) Transcript_9435:48-1097(-)
MRKATTGKIGPWTMALLGIFHVSKASPTMAGAFLTTPRLNFITSSTLHIISGRKLFYRPFVSNPDFVLRAHGMFGSDADINYDGLKKSRPIRIQAQAIDTTQQRNIDETVGECCKIVHFQRHGQGTHNEIYRIWTEKNGRPLDLSETDPEKNPLLLPHVIDAPLTEKGRNQCLEKKHQASKLNVELVIVSPLVRALQTAHITFADHLPNNSERNVKWVAHEGTREELGLLVCNQRRPLSQTKLEFPHVDFSYLTYEEDVIWNNHRKHTSDKKGIPKRETTVDMSHRCYDFLVDFLMTREEKEIAVVGHSAWLHAMCNAVIDCGEHDHLLPMFGQAELRSIKLTFNRGVN